MSDTEILSQINTPFNTKKWERLTYLDRKLQFRALSSKEESELLKLAEAYENYSVERVKNLSKLAALRNVSLDKLMEQLGLKPQIHG